MQFPRPLGWVIIIVKWCEVITPSMIFWSCVYVCVCTTEKLRVLEYWSSLTFAKLAWGGGGGGVCNYVPYRLSKKRRYPTNINHIVRLGWIGTQFPNLLQKFERYSTTFMEKSPIPQQVEVTLDIWLTILFICIVEVTLESWPTILFKRVPKQRMSPNYHITFSKGQFSIIQSVVQCTVHNACAFCMRTSVTCMCNLKWKMYPCTVHIFRELSKNFNFECQTGYYLRVFLFFSLYIVDNLNYRTILVVLSP